MNIEFTTVSYGSHYWKKALELREEVLRSPMGSRFSENELHAERTFINLIGTHKGALIATAALTIEEFRCKMQRVAVVESERNKKIGARLLRFCETLATKKSCTSMYCHARDTAVRFYVTNGYVTTGKYFMEDGIPHIKMCKDL